MRSDQTGRSASHRFLVVEPDATKRAFLAEAWAFFQPGFEVVTATGNEGALAWVDTFRPSIVSMSASLTPEAMTPVLDAVDEIHRPNNWCLVVERPPGSAVTSDRRPWVRIIDLWDPLSLEQVLRAGRTAADMLQIPATLELTGDRNTPPRLVPATDAPSWPLPAAKASGS